MSNDVLAEYGFMHGTSRIKRMENGVDVWIFIDNGRCDLDQSTLSPRERARGQRYRIAERQRQFYFSRLVGRHLFAAYLNVSPQSVDWSPSGPPIVCAPETGKELNVSLSHSQNILAIAVSTSAYRIGIDVEEMTQTLNTEALLSLACTNAEKARLDSLPMAAKRAAVQQLWTIKEAVLKTLHLQRLPLPTAVEVTWDSNLPDWRSALQSCQVLLVDPLQEDLRHHVSVVSLPQEKLQFANFCGALAITDLAAKNTKHSPELTIHGHPQDFFRRGHEVPKPIEESAVLLQVEMITI